jgi:hypothetical protein
MAGLVPAIHTFAARREKKAWMRGTSPRMTEAFGFVFAMSPAERPGWQHRITADLRRLIRVARQVRNRETFGFIDRRIVVSAFPAHRNRQRLTALLMRAQALSTVLHRVC